MKSAAFFRNMSLVVGIRAVHRIGQPEILPHHDAVLVAGIVELVVAGLPHPVADHGEVHVLVVAHGHVVFARAVAQQLTSGKPQLPPRPMNRRPLIKILSARVVRSVVGELPHAGLERLGVGDCSCRPYRRSVGRRIGSGRRIPRATTAWDSAAAARGWWRGRASPASPSRARRSPAFQMPRLPKRPRSVPLHGASRRCCAAWLPRAHRRGWYRAAAGW